MNAVMNRDNMEGRRTTHSALPNRLKKPIKIQLYRGGLLKYSAPFVVGTIQLSAMSISIATRALLGSSKRSW